MNQFVNFYRKHNISPVSQNITNLENHFFRRKSLYREIGITTQNFNNADVLEIGPGSGYNSLVTALNDLNSYTLIEPNETGFQNMIQLFKEHNINTDKIKFINSGAESVSFDKKFDIVLCEGLLPGLDNKNSLLNTLNHNVKKDGILVVTTADEISIFLELARRLIANVLTKDITNFDSKITLLSNAFETHLSNLKGSSRPIKDWVLDVLINPASSEMKDYFSLYKAIDFFGKDFYYYNSSPNIFTNSLWYKCLEEIPEKYNKQYLTQFSKKSHTLFLQDMEINEREISQNKNLSKLCFEFSDINLELEKNEMEIQHIVLRAINCLEKIKKNINLEKTSLIIEDIIGILNNPTVENVKNSKYLTSAFGKGQQYISFIKS